MAIFANLFLYPEYHRNYIAADKLKTRLPLHSAHTQKLCSSAAAEDKENSAVTTKWVDGGTLVSGKLWV